MEDPGTAQIGFAPKFQSNLEKNFTVINWDQRGAGLSYDKNIRRGTTIENMVTDTVELVKYLLGRFNQEKIFLSWSFLGDSSWSINGKKCSGLNSCLHRYWSSSKYERRRENLL